MTIGQICQKCRQSKIVNYLGFRDVGLRLVEELISINHSNVIALVNHRFTGCAELLNRMIKR